MSKIVSYIFKNLALIVGIGEAILKALAGIVSMTPTKKDDALLIGIKIEYSMGTLGE